MSAQTLTNLSRCCVEPFICHRETQEHYHKLSGFPCRFWYAQGSLSTKWCCVFGKWVPPFRTGLCLWKREMVAVGFSETLVHAYEIPNESNVDTSRYVASSSVHIICKGKAIPLQAWIVQGGSRRFSILLITVLFYALKSELVTSIYAR